MPPGSGKSLGLVRAGFDDASGNPAYRLLEFPPGEEGLRLRALFDQDIQSRDAAASRNDLIG
jgi:hypothetical protein